MKHVTDTGRAISAGRVTKRSKLVRTKMRGQERPLPWALQCHPKALTPTPNHPLCHTYRYASGHAIRYIRTAQQTHDTTGFARGAWLSGEGAYRVAVEGHGEFRHNSLDEALGWRMAAMKFGFNVEVYV